ncbi:hypothetical protein [Halosimplex pelagicum]|uniref:Glycosyltransferase family 39 protein n=1 Tax=Halosimplex pelagicum TaxID=869886 RepID=A0A7D5PDM0_9EURY|nr:hypothetical protein [Halosimplex pelagicum]QLH81120.1 hypothetical protein HZS54_05465 [Halosimplex pelagicum]
MTDRGFDALLVAAVVAVGIATRLSSLHLSPLPYNTDAFVFVSSAEQALAADGVALTGPAAPEPDAYLFVTLIAAAGAVVGLEPMAVVQPLVACLGVVPSLVAMAYARSLTADLPRAYRRGAAAFAGLVLAVNGPYLFRTMSVNAEVYGLALLACFVLALHRALATGRRRWLGASVALGLLFPFAHNLSTVVAGLVATTLVALGVARRFTLRRAVGGAVGVAGFWLLSLGYYEAVDLPRASAVSGSLGLFLAWAILAVALARWLDIAPRRVQRGFPLAVCAGGVVVLAVNAVVSIFPGEATTPPLLVALTLPLLLVVVVAAGGFPRLASERGLGMFAALVGPLAAMGFALTGGRTPAYLDLFVRSTTYAHLGLAVATAVALAWYGARRPARGRVVAVAVVAAVLVSAPFPFAGLAAFPFEPVTEPDEFDAATFATERVDGGWAADDHLAYVAYNYRGAAVTDAPTAAWLRGAAPPPDCPTLARASWTTVGAPTHAGPVQLSERRYDEWTVNGDVVYAGGADSPIVLRWGPGECRPIGSGVAP